MDETVKKLLEMKIHECIEMKDQGITIVRVPGGWVYSLYLRSIFQSVFVPFSTDMCRRTA